MSFCVQKATKSIEKGQNLTLLSIAVVSAGPPFPGHINVVMSRGDPFQNIPNFDLGGEGGTTYRIICTLGFIFKSMFVRDFTQEAI